jgi:hypothetical protein
LQGSFQDECQGPLEACKGWVAVNLTPDERERYLAEANNDGFHHLVERNLANPDEWKHGIEDEMDTEVRRILHFRLIVLL